MWIRKMMRTLWQYKAQFISMVIMIALGVGVFLGFNIEWYSLERNLKEIFEATGFADYRVYSEKGFSSEDLEAVLSIDGVKNATRYLSVNTSVKDDTDVVAVTVNENMEVSGIYLIDGEPYDETSEDGIWLSDQYARANGISLGDEMTLTYRNFTLSGTVRGLVKSSEYLICLPDETQLMPDYSSFGYAYISPKMLQSIIPALFRKLIGDSWYYQINVITDLEKEEFVRKADEALGKTWLILSKDETISWAEAMGEVKEGKTMGSILPLLFLAIAILTMVTTMHRITASEKTQIGTFKALGFRDSRILRHYSCYALMIGVLGSLLGIAFGYWLGWFIMSPGGAMATYIDLIHWTLYCPSFCWMIVILMNAFLTLIGFLSVKKMLRGTAADALRPYTPKKMRHLPIEETKTFKKLGFGTKWNLRDSLRHKSRTFMTLFGIVGCMILLVGGLGMMDTMNAFVDIFYEQSIHYKTRINLDGENEDDLAGKDGSESMLSGNEEAAAMADRLDADWCAQSSVQIGDRGFSLEIYQIEHDKVRFVDEDMKLMQLGDEGVYICQRVAGEFSIGVGDTLTFSPYGSDQSYTVPVAGIIRSMSEGIVMTGTFARNAGIDYTINTLFTDEEDIPADKLIRNIQTKQSIIDSFDSFMELMNVMIILLVAAAVVLGIVVLYNLGIMSYTERYREMATLKVVGFKDRKIAGILIGQNLWLSVIGILIGLPCGVGVLKYLLDALASEYELKLVLGPATYLVSILLTFLVSLIVGIIVAGKNRYIDMVAALKTEE